MPRYEAAGRRGEVGMRWISCERRINGGWKGLLIVFNKIVAQV